MSYTTTGLTTNSANLSERESLARVLQEISIDMQKAVTATMSTRNVRTKTCLAEIAGGCLSYCGADVPLTRAVGVGTAGTVSERQIEGIELFFNSRNSPARIVISERTEPGLQSMLTTRGYKSDNFMENWWLALERPPERVVPWGIEVRPVYADEADLWVRTVAAGFEEEYSAVSETALSPTTLDTFYCLGFAKGAQAYLATINGEPAGGAVLHVGNQTAHLRTASCRLKHRRLGVQTALLTARLQAACAAGCKIVFSSTERRGISARNLGRFDFTPFSVSFQMSRSVLSSR